MEFRLLGSIEVVDGDRAVDLGPRKQRALLCVLLLHANRVVTTDRILDQLWGDDAAGKENALWVAISRLRSALEPNRAGHGESTVLLTRDHGYLLQASAESIDINQFESGVHESRLLLRRDPSAAVERIDEALERWRGTPFEEFQHEEFVQLDVARLEDLRLQALELRAEAELQLGRAREQISSLEALHQLHPLRERFVELLMRSLYQAGRQADALRLFGRYRRSIGEDLGVEVSPELRRLEEQVLLHDPSMRGDRLADADVDASVAHNPFKGLRSFGEQDEADFFGRDRLVSDVIRRIRAGQSLVALIGASGSGKSSVVRAGVMPAVRKGAVDSSSEWFIAQMIPGSRPMIELEASLLRSSLDAPDSLTDQLHDSEDGLLRAALRVLPDNGRLLLVIDQFEELFTLVEDEAERITFLNLLGPVLDDPHGRVVVLLTLRADFYDRPLAYPAFSRRLGHGIINVPTLSLDELEEAVAEPMRHADLTIEPALLAALLTDVIGQPGALPLFQYTLTMLFDRRQGDRVTLEAYRLMGGLKGALAQRAEDLWSELDESESRAARQLFLRLVTITGDRGWTRRRVAASELTSLRDDLVATQRVIESFGQQRLLAFDRHQVSGSPTVEVAHEALLTEWPRLREWIDEARGDVVRHSALVAAMNEWRSADHNPDYMPVGQRLADYESWADQTVLDLTDLEQDFLATSVAARDDADRDDTDREVIGARLQRRSRQRLGLLFVAVAALVLVLAYAVIPRSGVDTIVLALDTKREFGTVEELLASGFDVAQDEYDITGVLLEPPYSNVGDSLRETADRAPSLMMAASNLAADLVAMSADYPDTTFVTFDYVAPDPPSNVVAVGFAVEQASFLVGAAAALESETGKIGYIGANNLPFIEAFRAGYERGAQMAKPDVEIISQLISYTEDASAGYGSPALARHLATQMFLNEGVDVIFAAAGGASLGVVQAAENHSTAGRHLWMIGVDSDFYHDVGAEERAHVLTSALKRYDAGVQVVTKQHLDGDLPTQLVLTLADGAVGYATSGEHLAVSTTSTLAALEQMIVDGELIVGSVPENPVAQPSDSDEVSATIIYDGTSCTYEGPGALASGTIHNVRFVNRSDEVAVLEISKVADGATIDDLVPNDYWLTQSGNEAHARVALDEAGDWLATCVGSTEQPTVVIHAQS